MRDEVGEPFEGDGIAVAEVLCDGLLEALKLGRDTLSGNH
jgi:hypothetical protein